MAVASASVTIVTMCAGVNAAFMLHEVFSARDVATRFTETSPDVSSSSPEAFLPIFMFASLACLRGLAHGFPFAPKRQVGPQVHDASIPALGQRQVPVAST